MISLTNKLNSDIKESRSNQYLKFNQLVSNINLKVSNNDILCLTTKSPNFTGSTDFHRLNCDQNKQFYEAYMSACRFLNIKPVKEMQRKLRDVVTGEHISSFKDLYETILDELKTTTKRYLN